MPFQSLYFEMNGFWTIVVMLVSFVVMIGGPFVFLIGSGVPAEPEDNILTSILFRLGCVVLAAVTGFAGFWGLGLATKQDDFRRERNAQASAVHFGLPKPQVTWVDNPYAEYRGQVATFAVGKCKVQTYLYYDGWRYWFERNDGSFIASPADLQKLTSGCE